MSKSSRSECPAGVEPAFPAWEAGAWAARPRALGSAEGEGVEPSRACASSRFERGAVARRLALPCAVWMAGFEPAISGSRSRRIEPSSPTSRTAVAMGPEGLEPSPHWLRARDAAANTWIPSAYPNEKGQASCDAWPRDRVTKEPGVNIAAGGPGARGPTSRRSARPSRVAATCDSWFPLPYLAGRSAPRQRRRSRYTFKTRFRADGSQEF